MEVDINFQYIDIQRAVNQVADILNLLEFDGKNKIPMKVKKFFSNYYDSSVEYDKIESGVPLKDQNICEFALKILTYITNRYLKAS